ncbi:CRISPR-associated protein Cas4 [Thermotoga sp. SG1]|nr:CRISPR-associated protein Cas4 [Thermotoga sp. SG1]
MSRNIVPDQNNMYIEIGRFLHEDYNSGPNLPGMKVDMLFERDGVKVVGEVKKSSASIKGAELQLLYYLFRLEERGVKAKGEIIVPAENRRITVELTEEKREKIKKVIEEISLLIKEDLPPLPERKGICRKCGYELFCFS